MMPNDDNKPPVSSRHSYGRNFYKIKMPNILWLQLYKKQFEVEILASGILRLGFFPQDSDDKYTY